MRQPPLRNPPHKADGFVDSIGVNTHFGNAIYTGGNAYADPGHRSQTRQLGVRHIRDHSWNDTALGIVDSLSATTASAAI